MNTGDLKTQFNQSLMILEAIVTEFSSDEWQDGGCGYQTPARLAFHTLLGIGYYTDFKSSLEKALGNEIDKVPAHNMPSQDDVVESISEVIANLDNWIEDIALDQENDRFPWAGETITGLVLFLLRHTMYHIGELNALIYQMRDGDVGDLWMKGFAE